MVIFHSYISLPDGSRVQNNGKLHTARCTKFLWLHDAPQCTRNGVAGVSHSACWQMFGEQFWALNQQMVSSMCQWLMGKIRCPAKWHGIRHGKSLTVRVGATICLTIAQAQPLHWVSWDWDTYTVIVLYYIILYYIILYYIILYYIILYIIYYILYIIYYILYIIYIRMHISIYIYIYM